MVLDDTAEALLKVIVTWVTSRTPDSPSDLHRRKEQIILQSSPGTRSKPVAMSGHLLSTPSSLLHRVGFVIMLFPVICQSISVKTRLQPHHQFIHSVQSLCTIAPAMPPHLLHLQGFSDRVLSVCKADASRWMVKTRSAT